MKYFRKFLILLLLSIFLTFLILLFFLPVLTAKNLIFPYSIHPFDIVKNYPTVWFYIKIAYYFSSFITIFLTLKSISIFFNFKRTLQKKNILDESNLENKNNLNLLLGLNSSSQKKVFIPEKGLFQNILVTGTIGSRKNKLCYVSIFRSIN